MPSIKELEINLPKLPTEEEWINYINGQEDNIKETAIVRAKGYNLLNGFYESKASAERIGWLNLWTKAMTALEAAISAYQAGSDITLQHLSRATFEYVLHVVVIFQPLEDIIIDNKSDKLVKFPDKMKIDRLRAYTAWCLWSDKQLYKKEMLRPAYMEKVWDSNPSREIKDDPEKLDQYEKFFGKLDIETDCKKLHEGLKEMEALYKKKVRQIQQWLEEPELMHWNNKLERLPHNKKGFFNLFYNEPTIKIILDKIGGRFGYASYSKGSMALHGSTMDQFVFISDSFVAPKLNYDGQGDSGLFQEVVSNCNHIFFNLGALDHFALEQRKHR